MDTKEFDIYDFDVVCDITGTYDSLKESGEPGIERIIKEDFEDMFSDSDDAPFAYIALALSHLKHKGKVAQRLKNKVLEFLSSDSFSERFTEANNEEYYRSFCAWKEEFAQQLENGVPLPKKERKKYKRLPQMNVGDIFCCEFEKEEYQKYGTILMIIVDHKDFVSPNRPVFYYALTKQQVLTIEDLDYNSLLFIPATDNFTPHVYRRVLLDKTLNLDISLRYIGNCSNYPVPQNESIPEETVYYGLNYLESTNDELELGFNILYRFKYLYRFK